MPVKPTAAPQDGDADGELTHGSGKPGAAKPQAAGKGSKEGKAKGTGQRLLAAGVYKLSSLMCLLPVNVFGNLDERKPMLLHLRSTTMLLLIVDDAGSDKSKDKAARAAAAQERAELELLLMDDDDLRRPAGRLAGAEGNIGDTRTADAGQAMCALCIQTNPCMHLNLAMDHFPMQQG